MQIASLVLTILAFLGMLFGLIQFMGWTNWFVIPFCVIGLIFSVIALVTARGSRGLSIAAVILCPIILVISIVRLILGFGIF